MNDDIRDIVLGLIATGIAAAIGWFARTYLWRRRLRRKQRFFGLPGNSECLLVVNRKAGGEDWSVARRDVFGLLELAALVKDCGANVQIVAHDAVQQGFGERTEFCFGGPVSNQRTAAHLRALLPGVRIASGPEPGAGRKTFAVSFSVGGETFAMEEGRAEYVLLARLTGGASARPVFLACGQRAVANQAAVRYLLRHHERLARKHGNAFCLLLKVVDSEAYGPDVVELVKDVTRDATSPVTEEVPESAGEPA
ncbi:hypothetical protein [Streptomyces meridianus]|uniref:Secreted protein n=1 Tax=Streptomyces meridianus TaxID=2938945 RepID=A0ABT0X2C3_9ACTN|nr:hypothetical protein [Streptomyces meridianus]MCM2576686.1 hypothetical protein [Streptomyces meridianus]